MGKIVNAKSSQVMVVFPNLSLGKYAVAACHDADGNGKINRNPLGMPTEVSGFSNNARGSFGPPKFENATFAIGDGDATIRFAIAK